jgi:hypothetical protein
MATKTRKQEPLKIELVAAESLVPFKSNSKIHPQEQIEEIERSMQEFGWTNPILIDPAKKEIIAGHGRLMAARSLLAKGVSELRNLPDLNFVPCVALVGLTAAQKRAYVIADNKLAENGKWDWTVLKSELIDLRDSGFDISLTGFNAFELDELFEGPADIEDVSSELEGAKALKPYMVFPSDLPYGMPPLRADMCAEIPPNLKCFAGQQVTPDDGETMWLWLWRSDSLRGLPRDRHMIGFYVDDYRFDCLYDETAKYVAKILNLGTRVCIAPNYSMFAEGVPEMLSMFNAFKARYVSRYMQEAGIAVIPDINWGNVSSYQYAWLGIPKGVPAVSVQLQNTASADEFKRACSGLRAALDAIEPRSLLVYGSRPAQKIIDEVRPGVPVTFVLNRSTIKASHIREGQTEAAMA